MRHRRTLLFTPYLIEQINTPTLVIHAMNDPIIPITSGEFSARTIPIAQFVQLEDGVHFVCVTLLEKTSIRLPGFVGLIVGGILVGSHGFGWLKNTAEMNSFQ